MLLLILLSPLEKILLDKNLKCEYNTYKSIQKEIVVDHIDFAYLIFLFAFTYAGYYCGRKDGILGALSWMEETGGVDFSDDDE
jgi:hypothetical protein